MELRLICHPDRVDVEMDESLRRFLAEGWADRAVQEGLIPASQVVIEEIEENFYSGGRPTWEAKEDGTAADLVVTGRLRDAATKGAVVTITENEAEVATAPDVDYAAAVNAKRPFMTVPDGQPMDNVAVAFLSGMTAEIKE